MRICCGTAELVFPPMGDKLMNVHCSIPQVMLLGHFWTREKDRGEVKGGGKRESKEKGKGIRKRQEKKREGRKGE